MNVNNTSPVYPTGTHFGLAYHGVLTLFGILRDIDPTKIYGKYSSHPIKKESRDLIFKLFEEAGFECIPLVVDYEQTDILSQPNLNYEIKVRQSNIPVSNCSENYNYTADKEGVILEDSITQISEEKLVSNNNIIANVSDGAFDENGKYDILENVSTVQWNAPGAYGALFSSTPPSLVNDSLRVCIFLHRTKLMCFYVSFDHYLQGYLDFTPSNVKFTQRLYKETVYVPDKKPDTYKTRLVIQGPAGLEIQDIVKDCTPSVKNISEYNYNEDFDINQVYDFIEKDESGLIIFHGEPGTGKTTFIKHLLMKYTTTKHKIVYLPINLASNMDNPGLLSFFLRNPETIYVIEDAEQLVKSRESGNNNLAAFLNATDGILSSVLSVKFLLTFNTKITSDHVDQALLRKGRLRYIYEFKKLKKDRASKLFNKEIKHDIPLTELYNEKDTNHTKNNKSIGF